MALPKLDYPTNEIEFKSLGKKIKFRPMLVKEEKLLLMAKQSEGDNDIFTAVKQVVNNCALDPKFDVDALPIFELEHAFLTLRMQSIGNEVDLSYHDEEDNMDYNFKVNLDDIKIVYPKGEKLDGKIEVAPDVGIVFRWPPARLYSDRAFLDSKAPGQTFDEMLYASIDKIYDADSVYPIAEVKREEIEDFLDSLTPEAYKKIQEFFISVPYMEYKIEYKNKAGTEREIVLRTLSDFFML